MAGALTRVLSFGRHSTVESATQGIPAGVDSSSTLPIGGKSDVPLSDQLAGWLLKRHRTQKTIGPQWAPRYIRVDKQLRTISLAKGPMKTPSTVLPLSGIKSVTLLKDIKSLGPNCFVVAHFSGVHMTLRADDPEEARTWVNQLLSKVALTKQSSSPGPSSSAGPSSLPGPSSSSGPSLETVELSDGEDDEGGKATRLARSVGPPLVPR